MENTQGTAGAAGPVQVSPAGPVVLKDQAVFIPGLRGTYFVLISDLSLRGDPGENAS